jgi:hypothetical protein
MRVKLYIRHLDDEDRALLGDVDLATEDPIALARKWISGGWTDDIGGCLFHDGADAGFEIIYSD